MRMKTDKLVLENVKYESSITHPTQISGAVMDRVALNILNILYPGTHSTYASKVCSQK